MAVFFFFLFHQAACRTQKTEEKLCFSLQDFCCGRGEGKQGTEMLNMYLMNTCYIPGHTLGAGERAVG